MAGSVNIALGLTVTDLISNFKVAGNTVNSFTSQFKAQFDGLKGSADAPAGALSSINRQLVITKRQIGDLVAAGAPVSTELASKFLLLKGAADSAKSSLNFPIQLAPYDALNQKLSDTKSQMQNILASGGVVPDALTAKYKALETEVSAVNRVFAVSAPPIGAYAALNQRLAETKIQIQDLRSKGLVVPAELTQSFRNLESQVASVNREFAKMPTQAEKLKGLGGSLISVGQPLSILSAGIGLLGGASFKAYGDIDGMQRALTVTAGSAQEAGKQFKEFVGLSKLPGLGLEEVVQAGLSLETLGYKAQTAQKYVSEVGNAIALGGKGKVEFGQVITQFTQMAGKAKVLGDDLKPIVNASPVIGKAINDMFGTIDSEQISKKLQAAGKGPKEFIAELVDSLSRLERVKGGPKNAMENFGDSVKLAEFQVASAADKVFGLTSKIDGLGDFVGKAAEKFGSLDPALQGTLLGLLGVVAAAGPVTLGIGAVLNVAASLSDKTSVLSLGIKGLGSAFAFLISPLGLAVAAAAALGYTAYSIYSFNKAVSASTSVAAEMSSAYKESTAAIASEQTQLNALVAVARNESLSKETRLSAIKQINLVSPKYLGDLTLETINTQKAASALAQYVRVLELKARAQIYQNRAAEASVKITDLQSKKNNDFVDTADAFAATLQGVANTIVGGESGAQVLQKKGAQRKAQAIKDAETVLKTSQAGLQSAVDQLAKSGETIVLTPPKISYKTGGGGKSELQLDRDRLKELKEEIYAIQKRGGDASAQENEAKGIKARIDAATSSLKKQKEVHEAVGSAVTANERILKRLSLELEEQGDKASESLKTQVRVMKELVDLDKARLNLAITPRTEIAGVQPAGVNIVQPTVPTALGIGLDPVIYQRTNAQIAAIVGNFEKIKETSPGLFTKTGINDFLTATQLAAPGLDAYRNKIEEIKNTISVMTLNNIKVPPELLEQLKALKKALGDAFAGAGAADAATNSDVQGEADAKFIEKAQNRIAAMKASGQDVKQSAEEMAADMKAADAALRGTGVQLLQSIGEGIGKGENPLKVVLKTILDILGDFMIKIGTAMVLGGTLLSAAVTAFPFLAPFLNIKGPAGIIAGGALVVGGGVVKGFAGSFEGGGLFRGESFIRVGESARAVAGGGEFVAPVALGADLIADRITKNLKLNDLQKQVIQPQSFRNPNMNISLGGEFRLDGSDLVAAINNHSESWGHSGNGYGLAALQMDMYQRSTFSGRSR